MGQMKRPRDPLFYVYGYFPEDSVLGVCVDDAFAFLQGFDFAFFADGRNLGIGRFEDHFAMLFNLLDALGLDLGDFDLRRLLDFK